MAAVIYPGVYISEASTAAPAIAALSTDVAGFVGFTARGPYGATPVTRLAEFTRLYGAPTTTAAGFLPLAVAGFFANGGRKAYIARVGRGAKAPVSAAQFIGNGKAKPSQRRALAALAAIDEISVVAIPDAMHGRVRPRSRPAIIAAAVAQCDARRDRVVLLDGPEIDRAIGQSDATINSLASSYAAVYGPWLKVTTVQGALAALPPSGHVAGMFARIDNTRGVWRAPAGTDANSQGVAGLSLNLSASEIAASSPGRVNAIRQIAGGAIVVWGGRTRSAIPEWQYVNVRRLLIFVERSIDKGLHWAVFEPNDSTLWTKVRAVVEQFLYDLWRNGALVGTTADQAFFVRCDRSTMSQSDLDNGRLICEIGVAPLRPAEFVIFRIGLWTKRPPS